MKIEQIDMYDPDVITPTPALWKCRETCKRFGGFVSIDHNLVVCSFLYSMEIMVVHPLAVVMFATWNDIAHITTLQ